MALLDGDISTLFASTFGTFFLDATLHSITLTEDGQGGGTSTPTNTPCKAQLDQTTQAQRDGGYADSDQRIIVLANGIDAITADDEITIRDQRWKISSVTTDPAGSYYDLRGRRSQVEVT